MPPEAALPELSTAAFRDTIANVVTSVSIVATDGAHGRAGLTCSAVCTASDSPPILVVCVHRQSAARSAIEGNGVLCVNALRAEHSDLSQMFAGVGAVPMAERFANGKWGVLATGAPVLRDALAALDCRVTAVREAGAHCMFLAEVVAAAHANDADPLIFHRRAYATTRPIA
jgi:chlorophenol-4-monooxygenase component 1